jgi:hypothetical protein
MGSDKTAEQKKRQTWVLDTETKGTGAEIVSLEKAQRSRSRPPRERIRVIRRERPSESGQAPEETDQAAARTLGPRKFKLVNVLTQQVVAEDVEAREIVGALEGVRSLADVHIYLWDELVARWRPLTFAEKKAFWRFRSDSPPPWWRRESRPPT